MADIFQEVDEDVRKERYEKLWKAYGKYLIGGVLAIVLATVAGVAWTNYQAAQREAEGERFAAAMALARQGRSAEAANAFLELAGEAGAGYRVLAQLQGAAALKAAGDLEGAVATYDRVAGDDGVDRTLRDLAALLAAFSLLDEAPPAELERRLAPLAADDNPWRYSARELAAVVALKSGDVGTARERFTRLADDADAPAGVRARAAELLATLGGAG